MERLKARLLITFLAWGALSASAQNSAINPAPRPDKWWVARHESFVEIARKDRIELLFLGDSITDNWRTRGSNVWANYYQPRRAANFGIGSDRTQHMLWRLSHGELDGIKPKVVVLLIGTNNTGKERDSDDVRNTTTEVVEGVTAVVQTLQAKLPESKILLLAIFPRGEKDSPQRRQISEINVALAKLDKSTMIKFLDLSEEFLTPDGKLPHDIMPDLLHPNAKGYKIWAEAMEPTLAELLQDAGQGGSLK